MDNKRMTLSELIELAKQDTPEAWEIIDRALKAYKPAPDFLFWVRWGARGATVDGVRDLAASILMASDEPLDEAGQVVIERWMAEDTYHIVRYRLAVALYQRGIRTDAVVAMMEEASNDSDVGELARNVLKAA